MNRSSLLAVFGSVLAASSAAAQVGEITPIEITPLEVTPLEVTPLVTGDANKLEASAESIARMKTALKQVLDRVEESRNEKDVVKLNCVNEKLTQIRSLLKVAEQADLALREAVASHDPSGEAEFAKIAIARTKIETLRAEADQCIGQLAYMVDEKTNVEVEQPANLPGAGGDALSLGVATRSDEIAQATAGSIIADSIMTGSDSVLGAGPPPESTMGPVSQGSIPPPPVDTVTRPPDLSPYL